MGWGDKKFSANKEAEVKRPLRPRTRETAALVLRTFLDLGEQLHRPIPRACEKTGSAPEPHPPEGFLCPFHPNCPRTSYAQQCKGTEETGDTGQPFNNVYTF